MTAAEMLRQAAEGLRSPMPCNTDPAFAIALASTMEEVASALELDPMLDGRVGYTELIATARAWLVATGRVKEQAS